LSKGLFITGRAGIGKTTVFLETIKSLKSKGIEIGGFVSQEVREKGRRIGFEVIDLHSSRKAWLAKVGDEGGPRVGKYVVQLKDFENVSIEALSYAMTSKKVDLIAVDELGPMELFSNIFRSFIKKIFIGNKPFLVTIHRRLIYDSLIPKNVELVEVTISNRETLAGTIAHNLYDVIKESFNIS
jgi:nucleoside-triphosphatase